MGRKQAKAILAALIAWPALAQEYNPVVIPGQIIGSPETTTPLNGGDDSTRLVQLGFPFEYFGQTFSSVYVSTNGFVSFNNVGHLCCNGTPIEQAPRNTIYGIWTDLISGGNPYYRSNTSEAVFGWYNTFEYGTNLTNTFEIALFPDGKVQWNYGDVNNQYHLVTAGLTGPASTDNVTLYYGQNPNLLDNTSYVALGAPPPPEPEPPFAPVDAAPSIIESPIAQQEVIEEQEAEQAVQEVMEEQEAALAETEIAEIVETSVAQEQEVVEEADAEIESAEEVAEDAERLNPDEVAALAAGGDAISGDGEQQSSSDAGSAADGPDKGQQGPTQGQQAGQGQLGQIDAQTGLNGADRRSDANVQFFQLEAIEDADTFRRERVLSVQAQDVAFVANADAQYAKMNGEQTTTDTVAETFQIMVVDGPTFAPPPVTGMGDMTTPVNQAQQMELLGMGGMQSEMASGLPSDIGDINSGDAETMAQLAATPVGYSAYTQLRLPDGQLYAPRDIYKGRRIPDANMALYRLMSGQDAKWTEMVDGQYD